MNIHDPERSTCEAEEKETRWYVEYFSRRYSTGADGTDTMTAGLEDIESSIGMHNNEKEANTKREFLCTLRCFSV